MTWLQWQSRTPNFLLNDNKEKAQRTTASVLKLYGSGQCSHWVTEVMDHHSPADTLPVCLSPPRTLHSAFLPQSLYHAPGLWWNYKHKHPFRRRFSSPIKTETNPREERKEARRPRPPRSWRAGARSAGAIRRIITANKAHTAENLIAAGAPKTIPITRSDAGHRLGHRQAQALA